jgi:C4-dicarboxylate-specific signal transduction histidine kinase
MTDYGTIALYLLPALVLLVLGRGLPTQPATLMAFSYASWAGFALVPAALHRDPTPRLIVWYVAADVAMSLSLAWFRHRVERESRSAGALTRAWLLGNYGAAAAMSLFTATFPLVIPLPTLDQQLFVYRLVFLVYYTVMAALVLRALVRRGGGAGIGLFALGVVLFPAGALLLGIAGATRLHPALMAAVGLTFTAPFVGPRLGRVVPAALVAVACSAAALIGHAAFTALGPLVTAPRAAADVTGAQLLAAALYALPACVLGICARQEWIALRAGRSSAVLPRLVLVLVSAMTVACALMAFLWLCPLSLKSPPPNWLFAMTVLQNWCLLGAVAVAGHATRLAVNPTAPGAAWLVANYGSAAAVGVGSLLFFILPVGPPDTCTVAYLAVQQAYTGAMLLVLLLRFARASRAGGWWRGAGDYRAGRADAVTVAFALVGMVVWALVLFSAPPGWQPTPGKLAAIVLTAWATTIPFAIRNLGAVVRGLLVLSIALVAAAAVHLGTQAFAAPIAAAGFERLAFLLTVVAFGAVLAPGSAWARAAIDRVVFRRSRRRRAELQAFVHALSPELGVVECCRRTLDRLVAVMRCRGAAVLLADGEAEGAGLLALEPLRHAWPRDGVPARALVGYELGELPPALHGALREAGATGVVPIESPGHRWGHLVFGLRLLDTAFRDDDTQAIEAVADQLALVLDGTALLARAREVERSLAHAEKLGALGELAARIAHEIRNPVTAARSLAQQLRRERPSAPDDPAALILGELDRVERQVAALLRFARREDLRLAPVDLGDLVRDTLEAYRPRIETAGVALEVDVADGVVVRADAERLRQVLVNLIENALDALADGAGERRLALGVSADNGSGAIRVRDTGAGVPPDRLPRLFEPFYTTKEHGTGLGLAIAKRTIDAHGGRLSAAAAPGSGAVFTVQLPTVRSMEP